MSDYEFSSRATVIRPSDRAAFSAATDDADPAAYAEWARRGGPPKIGKGWSVEQALALLQETDAESTRLMRTLMVAQIMGRPAREEDLDRMVMLEARASALRAWLE